MILKNLFTGQQWRNGLENRLMDMGRGEERVRCMEGVTWKLTLPYGKQPTGMCYVTQETYWGSVST